MEINTELIAKARTAKSPEELLALAKENGIELTEETAKMYFGQLYPKTGELDDDELDNVAGGGCYSQGGRLKTTSGYRCKHFSQGQSSVGLKGTCAQCSYWGVDPNRISGSLWSSILEVIMKAIEACQPRECYHPKNYRG